MFKGKENHLNLIQEVRTENALQKAEQQLLREDIQLVKTLTEQRDAARHEVGKKKTLASMWKPFANFKPTELGFTVPAHRRLYRRRLGRRR